MKVCFHTLGCKVNQYETQAMRELFEKEGYILSESDNSADVIVINTCSVTAESDRKSRQLLRKCRKANSNAVIVLTGCMVQAFPEISNKLSEADILIGNKDFSNVVQFVNEFIKTNERILIFDSHKNNEQFNTPVISEFEERTRAYMKIEDGCDRFCSYCIIPYARGRVRSKSIEEIKNEAEKLAKNGFSEIVLVGINLSAYGKNQTVDLCDAVKTVAETNGIQRVRLGSLEPDHITTDILKKLKSIPKFCPQFHLSLQSGCDETLKRMNRKYDSTFYSNLVSEIRSTFDDCSITTDIMVGFPGESDEEFEKSLLFCESIGFARAHIFPYSRRPGTLADSFPDQLANTVKTKRAKLMSDTLKKSEKKYLSSLIGKEKPVLFEAPEEKYKVGYTEDYIRVKVESDDDLIGKIKTVRITSTADDYCVGVIVQDF